MRSAHLLPVVLALFVTLAAKSALACGGCLDIGVQRSAWWVMSVSALGFVLLVELFVSALGWRAMRYRPRLRRARYGVLAVVLAIGLSLLAGGSGFLLGVGLLVVLGPVFVLSVWREMPGSRLARALRLGGVAAVLAVGLFLQAPSQRSTGSLIAMAIYPAHTGGRDGWVLRELSSRPDAVRELEARAVDGDPWQLERLLQLHVELGGAEAGRAAMCDRVLADDARLHERLRDEGRCPRGDAAPDAEQEGPAAPSAP